MPDNNTLQSLSADFRLSQKRGSSGQTPLYHQLYLLLKLAIRDGTIPTNSLLPGELRLAAMFNVSRITVKRALDELADENLVTRSRGRGRGTRVTAAISPQPWRAPLVGRLDNLVEIEKTITGRIISIERTVPPADIQKLLSLEKNKRVHKVIRLRSNETGEPYAYHISYTPGITKGFTKRNLHHRVRLDVLQDNGIKITELEQILSAENATAEIASCLDIKPGTALLAIRRISRDYQGRIVDVLDCWFDTRRYQYAMILILN